jgi:signal transduction histidine kinase
MHRNHLEALVKEKTNSLEDALQEWKSTSEDLAVKNGIIEKQNLEQRKTLRILKETQAQLIQTEKMASLGVLTAGVAHEINNPLHYLSGAFYGLNAYFEKYESMDKEATTALLSSIDTAIGRISEIVRGLHQISKHNTQLDEDCDVHSILDNCLEVLRDQINGNVQIEKQYHSIALFTKGNVGKLHKVFINILKNSIQAIKDTGKILIKTYLKGKRVVIEILDNGYGISKENLPKISDPFFTTKNPGEGTGLGLSIAYTIVQEHKGSIYFKSELNKGTAAIISLPSKELEL